jgi:pimeloyl-ACP methyl ester carboxylesterase
LATDASSVADVVRTLEGPVVLVGHGYGGAVISNVPGDAGDIVGLVYVAGFAPESGETCIALAGRFPGSTLKEALQPVPRADGTTDLYIAKDRFHDQFCAGMAPHEAAAMAQAQRPVTREALAEPSTERPLWRDVPSWFVFGENDRYLPATVQHFMAERAGARRAVEIPGGSHAITLSHPDLTAHLVLEAVGSRAIA